jgi:peptidoglycan/xylan/chitin deacetylase (PgdA/CDA1 family)
VTPRQLERHCRDLETAGYAPLSREGFLRYLEGEEPSVRTALFTFDDGYACVHAHARPILKAHGHVGVVFVPTGFVGRENLWDAGFGIRFLHLNAREIGDLIEDGWIAGSHGHRHPDLRRIPGDALREELERSLDVLETFPSEVNPILSYPYGSFDGRVKEAVERAGFRAAFASGPRKGHDRFALSRRSVHLIDRHIQRKLRDRGMFPALERAKEQGICRVAGLSAFVRYRASTLGKLVGIRE